MSEAEVRRPIVQIDYPLGEASTDELVVNSSVNAHNTASFTAFAGSEASEGSNKILSAEAAALMGRAQTLGFSKRTSPDTTIYAYAGSDTGVRMRMFLSGPTFLMQAGRIRPAFSAVAESSLIANLKLDIYVTNTAREQGQNSEMSEGVVVADRVPRATNLASRLKEVTETMIEYWNVNAAGETGPSARIKQQRHTINQQGPLEQWYRMLDNSVEGLARTADWLSVIARNKDGSANRSFNSELLAILRGTSRDFQEIIDELCGVFQLVVIPDPNGGAGKFALMDSMVTADPKDLTLPAESMLLNGDVSHDLLPVQQVLAKGLPYLATLTSIDPHRKKTDAGYFFVGGFPAEAPAASGDVMIVGLPSFIEKTIKEIPNPDGTIPPDISSIEGDYSQVKKLSIEYSDELAKKLVESYCRYIYIDTALGGSSTSITLPADLTLWPGERYRVKNAKGDLLFTGFLSGVTHTFRKSTGSQGQVTTVCNFTHIMFSGFTLPGVS